jgi:biotin carboxyl carrier protein
MRVETEQAHRAPRCRAESAPAHDVMAEDVVVDERLIVAPVAGTFFPAFTEVSAAHPGIVALGDEIGVLVQSGDKHPVTSPFTGRLMGMLAMPGERVRIHQPIAWLTTSDDEPA